MLVITDHEAEDYRLPDVENTVSNDLLDIPTATELKLKAAYRSP